MLTVLTLWVYLPTAAYEYTFFHFWNLVVIIILCKLGTLARYMISYFPAHVIFYKGHEAICLVFISRYRWLI
ncbi:hypothetical protein GIB67_038706 [Kingdonia uniflora]|uniref:Uncharacterized protein n=1 Tax=Kingdonia uniflora TaxID=39325 RepID=A0A7J7NSV1_9MAGN|nr:hypothetical protein GIB67_038706 [Kingdonia uniflora]